MNERNKRAENSLDSFESDVGVSRVIGKLSALH